MSEHDQQLRTTHRDCSIPSSAPSEEAAWAASELSEAPIASRLRYHQNKQQTTKSELLSNDPALPPTPRGFGSRPRPRNPAISSESDRILEQDPTQNEQDGSTDLPQNSPSRPPFEYSDETSLADGPAALVLTSTDSSNGPPSMPAQSPQTPVATASPGMKALIAQVPSPRLDLNRCKNRCGGIVFDVLAQDVLPAQTNEHRESLMKTITELVNAIAANLGISLDNPDAKLRILEFAQALYFRARDRIRRAAKIQSAFRPVEESGSLAQDQLYCLMMALRVVDRRMREVDEADLDAFEACCWVAAMKWQIDIHKNWITDLTVERKRKGRDGDEATASSCKHRRTVSNESEDSSNTALKRRPGRPAGVKNKKTVAAERREATIAATRNQNTALPVTPTRAPRPRGLPTYGPHHEHGSYIATPQFIPSRAQHQFNTPTQELMNQYSPPPVLQQNLQPEQQQQQRRTPQPTLVPTSRRRGAFSQQDRQFDLNAHQRAEALTPPSQPQVYSNHPTFYTCYSLAEQGESRGHSNGWVEDEQGDLWRGTDHDHRRN